jgi:dipeptidyl aminopeptidase/acylaminoacyl peptidase
MPNRGRSELDVDLVVGGVDLTEPRLWPDGRSLVHVRATAGVAEIVVHTLPTDDGRTAPLASGRVVTGVPAPRPGRGLGGGCWAPASHDALVVAAVDGNVWWVPLHGGTGRRLTDHGPDGVAQAPVVTPAGDGVIVVVDQRAVWWHPVAADDRRPARRLDDGSADFCFDPAVSPDGRVVVWVRWDAPDMPWDRSCLDAVDLVDGTRSSWRPRTSVQQPRFDTDGRLFAVCDDDGWRTVWRDIELGVDGSGTAVLVDDETEHAGPTWGLGSRSFCTSPDGRWLALTRNERGFGSLCVVDVRGRRSVTATNVVTIDRGVHGQLSWVGDSLAALRTGARTPPEITVHDVRHLRTGEVSRAAPRHVVETSRPSTLDRDLLAEPELVEVTASDGATLHARLYRAPTSATSRAICWLHGGPTDQWQVSYLPRIAYWRARGWHVLVPDHRGSTGHGRAYQQALHGRWGVLDVSDTVDAIRHLHRTGLATPATTALIGGSAGGFTVLGVLRAEPDLAAAAVVAYPVCDLVDLAERSHRFERHATISLVGELDGSDEAIRMYRDRSPVFFADQLTTPLLVLHGEDDPVVPVGQSRVLVERLRALGRDVELQVYPGEGHGFRARDHQVDEYRRTEAFLERYIGG